MLSLKNNLLQLQRNQETNYKLFILFDVINRLLLLTNNITVEHKCDRCGPAHYSRPVL